MAGQIPRYYRHIKTGVLVRWIDDYRLQRTDNYKIIPTNPTYLAMKYIEVRR